jgi:hypothetical protein
VSLTASETEYQTSVPITASRLAAFELPEEPLRVGGVLAALGPRATTLELFFLLPSAG